MSERDFSIPPAGRLPSDTESLMGDTAASEPLTTSPRVQPPETDSRPGARGEGARPEPRIPTDDAADADAELGHS